MPSALGLEGREIAATGLNGVPERPLKASPINRRNWLGSADVVSVKTFMPEAQGTPTFIRVITRTGELLTGPIVEDGPEMIRWTLASSRTERRIHFKQTPENAELWVDQVEGEKDQQAHPFLSTLLKHRAGVLTTGYRGEVQRHYGLGKKDVMGDLLKLTAPTERFSGCPHCGPISAESTSRYCRRGLGDLIEMFELTRLRKLRVVESLTEVTT